MKVLDSPNPKPHPRARATGWCGVAAGLLASACFALTLDAQGSTTQPIPVTVVVMPAAADEAAATFHLTDTDALVPEDIMLGPLVSAAKPDYQIVPDRRKVEVTQTSRPGKVENTGGAKDWIVSILVGNIIPFGESTVPVLVRGETKQTLRFQKPGPIDVGRIRRRQARPCHPPGRAGRRVVSGCANRLPSSRETHRHALAALHK